MKKNISVVDISGKAGLAIRTNKAPEINVKKKIRVLWYSDFLRHTGFGNVAEAIISNLQKTGKYQFEVIGINHNGDPYNQADSEYNHLKNIPVWPAYSGGEDSMFGYNKLSKMLATRKFDIFFALQDSFNMMPLKHVLEETRKNKDFRYIFYFPIDGDIHRDWVTDGIQVADYPVTYSEYGKKTVHDINPNINLDVIPHGADITTFTPFVSEEERQKFRKSYFLEKEENEFIITNVNRNQPRKDLPRCLIAFGEFCKRYPEINAKLYLHCHSQDSAGHRLHKISKKYLPKKALDNIIMPDPEIFGGNGYPIEMVSQIYAGSDIVTSTTLGEGWGLSTTEAMACKTPVVMPNNSATTEIIGENEERGFLVKSGVDPNLYTTLKHDNELRRPLTDINDLVEKWKYVYDNRSEAKEKAEAAYTWIQNMAWEKIAFHYWDALFQKAYASLKTSRE